jgi:hypothetical protein
MGALAERDHPITYPPSASVTYQFIRKSSAVNAQSMDALPVLPQTRECPDDSLEPFSAFPGIYADFKLRKDQQPWRSKRDESHDYDPGACSRILEFTGPAKQF